MSASKESTSNTNEMKFVVENLASPLDLLEWSTSTMQRFNKVLETPEYMNLLIPYNNSLLTQLKFTNKRWALRGQILRHIHFFYYYHFKRFKLPEKDYRHMEYILMVFCSLIMENTQKRSKRDLLPLENRIMMLLLLFFKDKKHHIVNTLLKVRYNEKSAYNLLVMQSLLGFVFFKFPLDVFNDNVFCGTYILYYKLMKNRPAWEDVLRRMFYEHFHKQIESLAKSRIAQSLFKISANISPEKLDEFVVFSNDIEREYFKFIKNTARPSPKRLRRQLTSTPRVIATICIDDDEPQNKPQKRLRRQLTSTPRVIVTICIDDDDDEPQNKPQKRLRRQVTSTPRVIPTICIVDDDDEPQNKPPIKDDIKVPRPMVKRKRRKMKQGFVDLTLDDDDDEAQPSTAPKINKVAEDKTKIGEASNNADVNNNSSIVSNISIDLENGNPIENMLEATFGDVNLNMEVELPIVDKIFNDLNTLYEDDENNSDTLLDDLDKAISEIQSRPTRYESDKQLNGTDDVLNDDEFNNLLDEMTSSMD